MDSIIFRLGETTIQLIDGEALFWTGPMDGEPDVVIDLEQLRRALSTAAWLRRSSGDCYALGA